MTAQRKSNPVPTKDGTGDPERCGKKIKRPKVELVPVGADIDTQHALERLPVGLEWQGFKIIKRKNNDQQDTSLRY